MIYILLVMFNLISVSCWSEYEIWWMIVWKVNLRPWSEIELPAEVPKTKDLNTSRLLLNGPNGRFFLSCRQSEPPSVWWWYGSCSMSNTLVYVVPREDLVCWGQGSSLWSVLQAIFIEPIEVCKLSKFYSEKVNRSFKTTPNPYETTLSR